MIAARRSLCAMTLVLIGTVSGCSASSQWTMAKLWSNPGYSDGTAEVEEWVEDAGAEGRAGRPVETELDPLGLKQIFRSEKALSIERNLGIE